MEPRKTMNADDLTVIKRNGEIRPFNIDKIHKMVELACENITGVSISDIEMEARLSFYDGISTVEIHRAITKAATNLISEQTPNYQFVAGRLLTYDIRKVAWGGMHEPRLYDHVVRLTKDEYYTPELLNMYSISDWDKMDSIIDHERDLKMSYIGVKEYLTKYAVRDRSLTEITPLETQQITYMLISALMCSDTKDLKDIKNYYNDISQHNISLPTPIMAGMRTQSKQFSSCVLISCDDTLKSIEATNSAVQEYISKKAGIGVGMMPIRAEKSSVAKKTIKHTGVTPYLRQLEGTVKSCCLTPDMWVEIIDGFEPKKIQIKDLKSGMKIKTYDHDTTSIVFSEITDVWDTIVESDDQIKLVFENGTTINCSINHPIMVIREDEIVEVNPLRLTTADVVITDKGRTRLLERHVNQNNNENYIDITVENHHTFFTTNNPSNEMILTHNSQGGVRGGAATVSLLLWHHDFEDLLVLKNNKGTQDNRVRKLDYCYLINDFLYQRVVDDSHITLFSPHDVPDLYESFFNDPVKFSELYVKYENDDSIRQKRVSARSILSDLIVERKETGRIYILNIDNANKHSSFDEVVKMTNLCVEILLPTTPMDTSEVYTIYVPQDDLIEVINDLGGSDIVNNFKVLEVNNDSI